MFGIIAGLFFFGFIFFMAYAYWLIFEKAGREGWESLIPVYNIIILLKIVNKPWHWILLMMIPLAGIYWAISTINALSKSFGKDEAFTLGLIFLPFVFYPVLGYGDAQYVEAQLEAPMEEEVLDSDLV